MDRAIRISIVQITVGADLGSRDILQGRCGFLTVDCLGIEKLRESFRRLGDRGL